MSWGRRRVGCMSERNFAAAVQVEPRMRFGGLDIIVPPMR